MGSKIIRKPDLLYPELSYQIIGSAFDVYNEIGSGHHEKYYQRALAEALTRRKLPFAEQVSFPLKYNGKVIGRKVLDFVVDDKVVVEIKKGDRFSKSHIDQVLEYLKTNNFRLAILINFGNSGVTFKRIVNFS